ncbi:DUF6907 domain-containing protein [Streptomyces sp. NRRL S-118]|uniref:DUF6907 domain-containing protein n=1 Tax=Streptomyces sp. NRRL S-118 TaxID=1463881 RepID=UPI0004C4F515|nr:hypothetical protein [Streptomyces sp. NRRL S-118]
MSAEDGGQGPLEGVSAEAWAWHQGALEGDPAVCGARQPGRPGFPCIWNRGMHEEHWDVLGRTWADEPLYVAPMAPVAGGRVTIETRDHGTVVVDEPAWCNGRHAQGGYRSDIQHQAEDSYMVFNVGQEQGPATLLSAYLMQRPFSPTRPDLVLAVDFEDQAVELDPPGLDKLAAALVEHASVLRAAARRLAALRDAR